MSYFNQSKNSSEISTAKLAICDLLKKLHKVEIFHCTVFLADCRTKVNIEVRSSRLYVPIGKSDIDPKIDFKISVVLGIALVKTEWSCQRHETHSMATANLKKS